MERGPYKNLPPDGSEDRPRWPRSGTSRAARFIVYIVLGIILFWVIFGF
ncbi:hypothetical protein [Pseudokordiimonas caeni]|nr:hypothetical protein [Pseudokordiimonas caeni]